MAKSFEYMLFKKLQKMIEACTSMHNLGIWLSSKDSAFQIIKFFKVIGFVIAHKKR